MKLKLAVMLGALASSVCAHAQQTETSTQGQNTSTVTATTYSPIRVGDSTSSDAMGNSTHVGNTSSTSGAHTQSQVSGQVQLDGRSVSGSDSRSTSGAAATTSGAANTSSGEANTSSGAANTNSGAVNSSNSSRSRAYALSLVRPVTSTIPMNCVVSESRSFDVMVFGGSSSTSRMDDYCVRRVAVVNACNAASVLDAVDVLRAEQVRETAASLECADPRINGAFGGADKCGAAMKYAVCPMAVREVSVAPVAVAAPTAKVAQPVAAPVLVAPIVVDTGIPSHVEPKQRVRK